ncbi:MAG: hypothetical protein WAV38_11860, partial [Xanthobacteraceae bacterium]
GQDRKSPGLSRLGHQAGAVEIAIKAQANNGSFYVAVRDTLAVGICGRWNGVQKKIGTTFASHLGGDGDTGVSGSSDDGCAADADTLVA